MYNKYIKNSPKSKNKYHSSGDTISEHFPWVVRHTQSFREKTNFCFLEVFEECQNCRDAQVRFQTDEEEDQSFQDTSYENDYKSAL